MAKVPAEADVLVLGEHPSAYLAAALLRHKSKLRVVQASIPGPDWPDHLVRVNPRLMELHALLAPLKRKLAMTATFGLQFLSADGATRSIYRSTRTVVGVSSYDAVRQALRKVAEEQGVCLLSPRSLQIEQVDEEGANVVLNRSAMRVKALIVAGTLAEEPRRKLAMPEGWDEAVVHRYSWVRVKGRKGVEVGGRPLLSTALDLADQAATGWLLVHSQHIELGVYERSAGQGEPTGALGQWVEVLRQHGVLEDAGGVDLKAMQSVEIPLAGALARESVGNRTLLIGPAGGFVSATGEDLFPGCWSAIYAAEVMKKALKEAHLQDALNAYRAKWRTTLGEYLRGPQQNLRFLLPLVYRNEVMSQRLAEAILLGKSVVR